MLFYRFFNEDTVLPLLVDSTFHTAVKRTNFTYFKSKKNQNYANLILQKCLFLQCDKHSPLSHTKKEWITCYNLPIWI